MFTAVCKVEHHCCVRCCAESMTACELSACSVDQNAAALKATASQPSHTGLFCCRHDVSTWREHSSLCCAVGPYLSPPLSPSPAFKTLSRWKLRKGNTKRDSEEIFYLCVSLSVFLSQFKLLWDRDSQTDSGAEGGDHTEGTPPAGTICSRVGASLQAGASTTTPEGLAAQLDEDGDLDVVRRPRAASASEPPGPPRDKVHPTILTQEEDDVLGDEALESSPYNVIKIGK